MADAEPPPELPPGESPLDPDAATGPGGDPAPRRRPGERDATGRFAAGGPGSRGGKSEKTKRAQRKAAKGKPKPLTGREAPKAPTTRQRTRELELALGRALTFPAVPVIMLPLDVESKGFLATHFTQTGPSVAKELAEASEQSAELREVLERMAQGSLTMTLLVAAVAYLAPPVLWSIGRRNEAVAMQLAMQLDEETLRAIAEQQLAAAAATMPGDGGDGERQPGAGQGSPPAAPEQAAQQ